ncbi:hypothetical protein TNCV_1523161 [Trichonephila clavipes]|nr:hypothetical protein TNCV_1523161 [Trichonephila clavipes]
MTTLNAPKHDWSPIYGRMRFIQKDQIEKSEHINCTYSVATRGLLAMDLVILNHQVIRTTPELTFPSPDYHTIGSGTGLELITRRQRDR